MAKPRLRRIFHPCRRVARIIFLSVLVLSVFLQVAAESKSVDERIYIAAAGGADGKVLKYIKSTLPGRLPMTAKTAIEPDKALPQGAYSPSRKQYNAFIMLDELSGEVRIFLGMERAIFIVEEDLFTPDLNFVFGLADPKKGTAIVSLARLRNEYYGLKPDSRLFNERLIKEVVHELGHTWGISHCSNTKCVMYFSESIQDTDKKRDTFCLDCRVRLGKRYDGSPLLGSTNK